MVTAEWRQVALPLLATFHIQPETQVGTHSSRAPCLMCPGLGPVALWGYSLPSPQRRQSQKWASGRCT